MSARNDTDWQEFSCPEPITADVRLGGGDVTVQVEHEPVARVAVLPYDGRDESRDAADNTTVQFLGDRLHIETPETGGRGLLRRSGRVRIDLRLPLASNLRIHAGSADVHATGRLGEAVIRTGSGDTYVAETAGGLRVDSGSGDIRAEDVGGELRVKTGSGDLKAVAVAGAAVVDVASGDVSIEDAAGPVHATSASGDIQIASAHGGQLCLKSASGDVWVGVPTGTRVWLDLSTVSGSTTSDLEMSGHAPAEGAQVSLQVRTISGDITVRRVGPPPRQHPVDHEARDPESR